MSDKRSGEIALVPSRTRRRLLALAGASIIALALVLAAAGTVATLWAAGACALAAAAALGQAFRREPNRSLTLDPRGQFRAQSVSRMRIVFFAARRRVVVWHDATDPATFRRLAVLARWQPRGLSR